MVSHVKLKHLENSMERLGKSLNDMIDMFSGAATAMHVEEKEEKALDPVMKKLDMLIDQNQKIASGILAVADMIREQMPRIDEALSRLEHMSMPVRAPAPRFERPKPMPMHSPAPHPMIPPMPSRPQQEAPMPPGLSAFERPAPSQQGNNKRSLGGLFK